MDLNTVTLSGRVLNMSLSMTYNTGTCGVAEGRLVVNNGKNKDGDITDMLNIRAYGKKALSISEIKDGTFVTLQGRIREDLRINSDDPNKVRSKLYIDIERIKIMEVPK